MKSSDHLYSSTCPLLRLGCWLSCFGRIRRGNSGRQTKILPCYIFTYNHAYLYPHSPYDFVVYQQNVFLGSKPFVDSASFPSVALVIVYWLWSPTGLEDVGNTVQSGPQAGRRTGVLKSSHRVKWRGEVFLLLVASLEVDIVICPP